MVIHTDSRYLSWRRHSRLGRSIWAKRGGIHQIASFAAQQFPTQPLHMHITLAAFSSPKIELQIAITCSRLANMLDLRIPQRGSPKICVEDNSVGVDAWPKRKAHSPAKMFVIRRPQPREPQLQPLLVTES